MRPPERKMISSKPESASFLPNEHQKLSVLVVLITGIVYACHKVYQRLNRRLPPIIYDRFIVNMTEVWYRYVLERLCNEDKKLLDVGIGTAGLFSIL